MSLRYKINPAATFFERRPTNIMRKTKTRVSMFDASPKNGDKVKTDTVYAS